MFAGIPIHLLMLTTMCPDIIFSRLTVIWTFGVVTTLLGFILIKIKRHGYPFFLGSHAKKGIGYPIRVLSSIAPPYTTNDIVLKILSMVAEGMYQNVVALHTANGMLNKDADAT